MRKETHSHIYSSKIAFTIDLMVTYVIPLFYAFKHHEKLLRIFLDQHPDQELVKEYRDFCNGLYIYLEKRNELLKDEFNTFEEESESDIAHLEIELKQLQLEWIMDRSVEEIEQIENEIKNLKKWISQIRKKITLFKKRISNPVNELDTFLDQTDLYCINPIDGYGLLYNYFKQRNDMMDLLCQHKEVIRAIALKWIKHIINKNLPIRNHPLPLYLCPFNTSDNMFKTNIKYEIEQDLKENKHVKTEWEITLSYLAEHLNPLSKRELPHLISLINSVQEHFKLRSTDQSRYEAGHPSKTDQARLFKPADNRKQKSDEAKKQAQPKLTFNPSSTD